MSQDENKISDLIDGGLQQQEEFQKAVEWFFDLPHEEAVKICKEVNPNTPYSMNDKDLVPVYHKHNSINQ